MRKMDGRERNDAHYSLLVKFSQTINAQKILEIDKQPCTCLLQPVEPASVNLELMKKFRRSKDG